jgi:hypothetical protein
LGSGRSDRAFGARSTALPPKNKKCFFIFLSKFFSFLCRFYFIFLEKVLDSTCRFTAWILAHGDRLRLSLVQPAVFYPNPAAQRSSSLSSLISAVEAKAKALLLGASETKA